MTENISKEEKMKGALAYICGAISGMTIFGSVSAVGAILGISSGILFLFLEKKSSFVRFHAMQSVIVFGSIYLFNILLGIVPILNRVIQIIISPVLFTLICILWLVLMYKAYSGEKFKLQYFGDLSQKYLEKLK